MTNFQKISFFLVLTVSVGLKYHICVGLCDVDFEGPVSAVGKWGPHEECPGQGTFVTGMQLKSQPNSDSALYGIEFTCSSPLCGNVKSTQVTSTVLPYGTYGSNFNCGDYGYVVGFQLNSYSHSSLSIVFNLRIVCNDGTGKLTLYQGDGNNEDKWIAPELCPIGMAITFMETQATDNGDESISGLNNLYVICTSAPYPC